MFNKILIANRGEIALRVIRAAHELGVKAVAVYSEADRLAPHVLAADEAYLIGPAPSAQSYLKADVLIDVAKRCGAQAIHPGYGFLSERAHFIQAVRDAGLVFIGPSPDAVTAMGDKTAARARMIDAGVPVVPGTKEALADAAEARRVAGEIGYPVLLKAAAGGGGKGMRIVRGEDEIEKAFESAGNEAQSAFGDRSVYIEKFLEGPRHIEIQLLADRHGTTLHLGERECSIQRRHQKLIEEAPSAVLTPDERAAMGAMAVAAARAVNYEGAGTVECLYQNGEFFFLEMNTRIQVEHPVTELVTGIDLVQWQIRIAAGEKLPFAQDDITFTGHAIECRITSEDPANNFMPSTGRIQNLLIPSGPGVRWDGGITPGVEVGLFYDPMLAKLIVHAPTRIEAVDRMKRALAELRVEGVDTSVPFHLRVMDEPEFREGRLDIKYLERHEDLMTAQPDEDTIRAAALAAALLEEERRTHRAMPRAGTAAAAAPVSGWRQRGWRNR
ncbi:acetyl-CoA carboxylase biotin carboxylase subunit [Longimicrobium terrae]|uniref:Acetyl-CoA carboxylase biotin carboxylase subunit n=1 Tax=Longimicrobium terrae TaxID=1639882 RepID=A0A841GW71_9BACT|nr:acetyl-CoA carboxylase biotin carboxylase subunit [Longimicrobium terrae]MBB6069813.1 acetyl-CoA carboxylase biotin carboxylase subunit [Longimicrobium terrae]NNC30979.1 acetyl-CoA carboxylase biotin carboxylase subunit [Longimicrobium terrae]